MKTHPSGPTSQARPPQADPLDGWPDPASLAALRAWYEGLSSREAVHRYLASARAPGQSSRGMIGAIRQQLADIGVLSSNLRKFRRPSFCPTEALRHRR